MMTPEPVCERLIIGDTTVEAAQEAFKTINRGLLGLYDEMGGWFGSMDRYGSAGHNASDRAFMLQAYNGGPYRVDRIQRGTSYLHNISLTILGGIQPDLIRKVTRFTRRRWACATIDPDHAANRRRANLRPASRLGYGRVRCSRPTASYSQAARKRRPATQDSTRERRKIQHDLALEHRNLVKGFGAPIENYRQRWANKTACSHGFASSGTRSNMSATISTYRQP